MIDPENLLVREMGLPSPVVVGRFPYRERALRESAIEQDHCPCPGEARSQEEITGGGFVPSVGRAIRPVRLSGDHPPLPGSAPAPGLIVHRSPVRQGFSLKETSHREPGGVIRCVNRCR